MTADARHDIPCARWIIVDDKLRCPDNLTDERVGNVVLNAMFRKFTRKIVSVIVRRIVLYLAAHTNRFIQQIGEQRDGFCSTQGSQCLNRVRQEMLVHVLAKECGESSVLVKDLE
jgi:hypothetical protein